MFKRGWEYVVTVFRVYKTHVSGWLLAIVAIGLTIAAAVVQGDQSTAASVVKWAAWLTGGAAIWLVFVAQYDAWRQEREAKQTALDELSKDANMHGTIYVWPAPSYPRPEGRIQFKCDCANLGRKSCQITKIFFDIDVDKRTGFRFEFPFFEPRVKVVEHERQYQESGTLFIANTTPDSIIHSVISAGLIDSVGKEYKANIRTVAGPAFSSKEAL